MNRVSRVGSITGLFLVLALAAGAWTANALTAEEFEAQLGWENGDIRIGEGAATLRFSDAFRYLAPDQARRVLVDAWGNPPEAAEDVLGMIFPAEVGPTGKDGWGVVVTYEKDGYVSDEGADQIDYAAMLREMQEATTEANEELEARGFAAVELVGWAQPPHYDRTSHKLYWAKQLRFAGQQPDTLNYNIRVLGRHGVLVLNAVAGMDQLPLVQREMERLLPRVEFNEGHRYADFIPGKDKVAEYGLVALIAGGAAMAAKGGLLKWLLGGLLAFKKFAIVGVAALAAGVRRLLSRRGPSSSGGPIEPT